jgi:hypothetical protein
MSSAGPQLFGTLVQRLDRGPFFVGQAFAGKNSKLGPPCGHPKFTGSFGKKLSKEATPP